MVYYIGIIGSYFINLFFGLFNSAFQLHYTVPIIWILLEEYFILEKGDFIFKYFSYSFPGYGSRGPGFNSRRYRIF
jgi:hypothetical protein